MTDNNSNSIGARRKYANEIVPDFKAMTEHPTDATVTPEMIEAGWDALVSGPELLSREDMKRIYLAMEAAKPSTPVIDREKIARILFNRSLNVSMDTARQIADQIIEATPMAAIDDEGLRPVLTKLLKLWDSYLDSDLNQMNAHDCLVRYEIWNEARAAIEAKPNVS